MDAFINDNPPLCIDNEVSEKPLTFGIEIEIAIATLDDDWYDPHPEDGRNIRGLFRGGFLEEDWQQFQYNTWDGLARELAKKGISLKHTRAKVTIKGDNGNSWAVCLDASICAPKGLSESYDYLWIPAEIVSPAFEYCEAALTEVKIFVETLASKFRINCNRSSGIHVHVGNGPDGFVHETIRNLFATLWTFEPQIMTIHPNHRLTNEKFCPCYRTGTCCGYERTRFWNRKINPLQDDAGSPQDLKRVDATLDVARGLEDLLASEDITEIRALNATHDRNATWIGGYKMAYHCGNVENLPRPSPEVDPYAYAWKPTIEFRQHRSTLDAEHIDAWIRFCVQLVQFAQVVPREVLDPFVREHVRHTPEEFTLQQVLMRLGMVSLAFKYPRLVQERVADEDATGGRVETEELFNCVEELLKHWSELKAERKISRAIQALRIR